MYIKYNKLVCIILSLAILCLLVAFCPLNISTLSAISTKNSSYHRVDEILKSTTSATGDNPFNTANLKTLVNMISNKEGNLITQVHSLENSTAITPLTAGNLRNNTYNKSSGQSLVVRIGGLDWLVTYVSTDNQGNLIATLMLTNSTQSAWGTTSKKLGSYCGLFNEGLYSQYSANWFTNTNDKYPSLVYGTSYVRTEALNNPYNREYALRDATDLTKASDQKTTVADHPLALFTVEDLGFTRYITQPRNVNYQRYIQNTAKRSTESGNKQTLILPNESLYKINYYNYNSEVLSSAYDFYDKEGYTNWDVDYLWLPSWTETGDRDSGQGLWELTSAERANYDGATAQISSTSAYLYSDSANTSTWWRSGNVNYYGGVYGIDVTGTKHSDSQTHSSFAIRPAFHFNLTQAISTYSSTAFDVTVTNDNRMSDDYLNSEGDSYGSAFDTSKMTLTVQIYSLNNALIASHTFSTLTTTTVDMGTNLAANTYYRVKIIAPTYMRYTVTHTLSSANYNDYISNTFTIYNSGTQSIEIDFQGIQDDSWQTFYK